MKFINKIKKLSAYQNKMVSDFINLFKSLNNREPMEGEVVDNLKDKIEVSKIKTIMENLNSLSVQINVDNDDEALGLNMI